MVREEAPFWGCSSDRADWRDCMFSARGGARTGAAAASPRSSGSATGGGARPGGSGSAGNYASRSAGTDFRARAGSACA